ncbi:MAG: transposase [Desulfobacterales bacterium]
MKNNFAIHHRRSIRLQGYDYSRAGAYFVTICTKHRKCLYGNIVEGRMRMNEAGLMVQACWDAIPDHFPQVELDAFVLMPNHVHGILSMVGSITVGAKNFSPLTPFTPLTHPHGTSKTIGSVVRGFKIGVTKWMRHNTAVRDIWQRNYWERIIRDEVELNRIREYIQNNPVQWETDPLNGQGARRAATSPAGDREVWMV